MTIGERIRALRVSRGMTLQDLGDRIDANKSTIKRWEDGSTYSIDYKYVTRLAKVFNVPLTYFMSYDDDEPGEPSPDDPAEVMAIRQALHDNPDLRILFDLGKGCTPAELRKSIAILKTMMGDNDE